MPGELKRETWQLMNSTMVPEGAELAANYYKGAHKMVSSVHLTSATNWFLGNFKESFWWLEVWPLQLLQRDMKDTDQGFQRDIIAQFKTRFYGTITAIEHRLVYKSTA